MKVFCTLIPNGVKPPRCVTAVLTSICSPCPSGSSVSSAESSNSISLSGLVSAASSV